ncbi:hypothetical protein JOD63_003013 [Microbacterium terrae]|uniref:Alpha/beta hydrolase family protein n=1 Tax=Microbacterium terrae TaxID=69369 RepID=A0A0M2H892_9MICO|nr:hypothetical protein [Microbacterium terrae]KJL42616.1 hypothetical protein RS81_01117 [Microbacterium terrae]MBP1079045.1 hypothetical protein [Microbacterium terrae]GLJ98445.1 hypothetical protein GCM10017594_16420 [Microbacterium terrae]
MSLEIRGGGAVSVDTATLRATAARFLDVRDELEAIAQRLGAVQNMLFEARATAWEAANDAAVLGRRIADECIAAAEIAEALREAAAIYELVEVNAAHHAAVLAGDRAAAALAEARRSEVLAAYPDADLPARLADFERQVLVPGEIVRQATEAGFNIGDNFSGPLGAAYGGVGAGGAALAFGMLANLDGRGRLTRDARLTPRQAPVTVARVSTAPAAAPRSLAAAVARMPTGDAQVRVERYTMPDGSRRFVLYVAGTRSVAPSTVDPWDGTSNLELYSGVASASYVATQRALDDAGVRPGDVVHAIGHSQGAMITTHLALEGGYDTQTSITLGSPVQADLDDTTLSVDLRHTDDPVVSLAGGGHVGAVGAPGSFIVETVADPAVGLRDAAIPAHQLDSYAVTAADVDASGDPRVAQLQSVFDELGGAVEADAVEYGATRGGDG